jgi:hypothetical protein
MEPARASALEPDAVVARPEDFGGARLIGVPLLVAEILSPDSAMRDLNLKKAAYERFGVASYWVIDPDLDRPSLRSSSCPAALTPSSRASRAIRNSARSARLTSGSSRPSSSPSCARAQPAGPSSRGRESPGHAATASGNDEHGAGLGVEGPGRHPLLTRAVTGLLGAAERRLEVDA